MGRSPCRMARDGRSVEYFNAIVSASVKNYSLLQKKVCVIFLCVIWSIHFSLTFLCHSSILSFSKLSLFLGVSEMKCKCGNNKRLWPRWNFPPNNSLLYSFEYNYVKTAFTIKGMVFWIPLKFLTLYREIRTTCSVNTFSVGRQLQKFTSDKYFWMDNLLGKNILPMK